MLSSCGAGASESNVVCPLRRLAESLIAGQPLTAVIDEGELGAQIRSSAATSTVQVDGNGQHGHLKSFVEAFCVLLSGPHT